MVRIQTEVPSWFQHALVTALALAVGVSFGLSYGLETHTSYLLYPLRELDPGFLRYDWLASQTELVHKSFALIVRGLVALGPLPWTVALANVILVATFVLAIYGFLYAKLGRDALVSVALFMFFLLIDRTTSIADTHILTVRFEPSAIAGCLVMMGFLTTIMGRYAWSGALIAVAGIIHSNYLLLDFVFFGLAHLAFGRQALVRRLILQLGPSTLILFYDLPMLYAIASDPLARDARHVITFIRAPHHELPLTVAADFLHFAGWHLLAMSCIGVGGAKQAASSRLVRVYLVCTGVVIAAALLTTAVVVTNIAQLRFFRMAPVSIVLAQLIVLTSIASFPGRGEESGLTASRFRLAVAGLGAAAILTYYCVTDRPLELYLAIAGFLVAAALVADSSRYLCRLFRATGFRSALMRPEWVPIAALAIALLASTAPPKYLAGLQPVAAGPFHKRYNVLLGDPRPFRELFTWARSTPLESQFLIPPNLKSFRILSQRAVVVDWQTTPWKPFELMEWYRRLGRVSGKPDLKNLDEAETGYAEMNRARLASLEKEFSLNYAVFRRPFDVRRIGGKIAFMNDAFIVLKVQDERSASREPR